MSKRRQLYTVTITEETTRVVYVYARSDEDAIEGADEVEDYHSYTERTAAVAELGDTFGQ